jgi:hypothetical protein
VDDNQIYNRRSRLDHRPPFESVWRSKTSQQPYRKQRSRTINKYQNCLNTQSRIIGIVINRNVITGENKKIVCEKLDDSWTTHCLKNMNYHFKNGVWVFTSQWNNYLSAIIIRRTTRKWTLLFQITHIWKDHY